MTPDQEADFLEQLLDSETQETTEKEKSLIRKAVDNAIKAISKILPNLNIVIHETNDAFVNATGDKTKPSGLYVPNKKGGGTVHINISHANARTVGHEVFHGIL
jgi:hypothetical protein